MNRADWGEANRSRSHFINTVYIEAAIGLQTTLYDACDENPFRVTSDITEVMESSNSGICILESTNMASLGKWYSPMHLNNISSSLTTNHEYDNETDM